MTEETPRLAETPIIWEVKCGFLLLFRRVIRMHAWQCAINDEGVIPSAMAKVRIFINAQKMYERKILYPMPYGMEMLAVQLYMMSQSPEYIAPQYRTIIRKASLEMIPDLEKQVRIVWNGGMAQLINCT